VDQARPGATSSEYKSFYKELNKGNESEKCRYNKRLDTYGCGCQHDCRYCYAKSLLHFRGLWDAAQPHVADIKKIEKVIRKIPAGTVVRMGGMSDCFQPLELTKRVTLDTIRLLNHYGIGYLIVTKSHLVAYKEYLDAMDTALSHIQITVTCLDDDKSLCYEKASVPGKRILAYKALREKGYDASVRLSPIIEEYMDFERLSRLEIDKGIVEFLRVNTWIKQWFPGVDYSKYTLRQSNYYHLPLEEKLRILSKIDIKNLSVCEDVTEHYTYWKEHFNPNPSDCCNLRR